MSRIMLVLSGSLTDHGMARPPWKCLETNKSTLTALPTLKRLAFSTTTKRLQECEVLLVTEYYYFF